MQYAEHLARQGYAFIPGKHYQSLDNMQFDNKESFVNELETFKKGFEELTLDPYSPGNRWRGYAQCQKNDKGEMLFGKFTPYKQTKAYNPDTGGIVRDYPLLPENITNNRLLQALLEDDFRLVEAYERFAPLESLTVGIHLFRYEAAVDAPAYSSPVWLHKDDEDVVFVHLVNASPNMLGGDSLIASHPRCIERVLRLEHLFDTLVVNHDKLHAVTPVGTREDSGVAQRDIVLITFQRNEQDATCTA
ncbi:3(1)-hydroxy-L-isoleucine 4-dioxygenase HilB [Pantoea sp. CCBC3-3-1]|uniref:3(1)-hydroxy-L-isoleucine 4-dioxygenase HilB n=1 Tax=Pantoea sp. CCBC3-3-1 TaxID=2490851 RepID=UPI0020C5554E|nr:3(1)-hydroxy-L-isoleucine 4-dioxygenase HilB [Pantoea sp. CCBC3-3-1]